MTKTEYLQALTAALEKGLPIQDIYEITADYAEYFDTGMQEGKTEDELTSEFGLPATVAQELLRDKKDVSTEKARHEYVRLRAILGRILAAAGVIAILFVLNFKQVRLSRYGIDILLTTVLPILLLVGGYHKLFKPRLQKAPHFYIAATVVLLGVLTLFIASLAQMLLNAFSFVDYILSPEILGMFMSAITSLTVLLIVCAVLWLLHLSAAYAWAKGLLFYPLGAFFTLSDISLLLREMVSPETLAAGIYRSLLPVAVGIVLTIVFALFFIRKQGSKRQEDVLSWTGR